MDEVDFYKFFGSLDALRQEVWVNFFENAEVSEVTATVGIASMRGISKVIPASGSVPEEIA
jgi:hypothetical protein